MGALEHFSHLIDLHLDDKIEGNRSWCLKNSNISGRGVFATRDIKCGEVIFKEKPLLIGPTGRKETPFNTCTVCYNLLEENDCLCDRGCSLPVCKNCKTSDQHSRECDLFRKWKPIEQNEINPQSLRFLAIARGIFLNKYQKELLYAMQANPDSSYKTEISKAAKCFYEFLDDNESLELFHQIILTFNTNAFESHFQKDAHEIILKGLYPLAGTMNHECTPNTCHEFEEDNSIIVRACKFISKGSEVTTTYSKLLWSNMSRRIFLTMTKGFTCMCSRCCDPTENGTYLSAIFCRKNACFGYVVPEDCLENTWICLKCQEVYDVSHVSKLQNFSLNAINSKISSSSVKELIEFVNERVPKICPPSNQLALEAKLNVIWRMHKSIEDYSKEDYLNKIRYCEEILEILQKLQAGECTLKKSLLLEIEKAKNSI